MTGAKIASSDSRLLLAEISTARLLLAQLSAEVEGVRKQHPTLVPRGALIAIDLHSYCTKLESLLERILVSFEGQAPRGEAAHAGLLRVAALAIPGIRPAIFGEPGPRKQVQQLEHDGRGTSRVGARPPSKRQTPSVPVAVRRCDRHA